MPAAAVIQRPQALSGFIGRKAFVGGFDSPVLNSEAQLRNRAGNVKTRGYERLMELTV